jgi:peroxiredoxin
MMKVMHWQSLWTLAIAILVGAPLSARAGNERAADRVGATIPPISLSNSTGKPVDFETLRGKNATIVVFLSFECPICNNYVQTLGEMFQAYRSKGATVVGVVVGDDESAADVARQAKERQIAFPVLRDEKHAAADAFGAAITPEAFLLDDKGVVRYRGRIDNRFASRVRQNTQVTSYDLRQALDSLLAGKPIPDPVTKAVGCAIVREPKSLTHTGNVTFYRDVLPIMQNKCQACHRPGEVGPFSLMTYRQAVNWAADIKDYTQSRRMPPWKPTEGLPFQHERKLADPEIATIAAWVDAGTPEGDSHDAPPPRKFVEGWQRGTPDLILESGDFQVGPSGSDIFRCYVMPTNLPEDKYVTAVEVRPGNSRIAHHALIFLDTMGQGRKLEAEETKRPKKEEIDKGPGYFSGMGVGFLPRGSLGGWAPGQISRELPEGTGYFLPKGADVVMQMHYHRDGKLETDRTRIGIYFARKPVARRFQGIVTAGGQSGLRFFMIPPGANHLRLHGTTWVDQDCDVHSVMPHMHLIGRDIKVTMTQPGGPTTTLVHIPDWDYNWQETYFFKEPIHVKAGTKFEVEAFYDNSAANPNNPSNPPKLVTFGEQTTNEMCFGFIGATTDQPGRIRMRFNEQPRNPRRALTQTEPQQKSP